ncbi:putative reverse transcriptase domain-containing protein [Tanacetum coccineum]
MPSKRNHTTTPMSDAAIKALVARSVVDALVKHEANRSRNRDDSHDSGSGGRRQVPTARECTYSDFLKCQPLNFKGTKGVVRLTQWFERMESVFYISNFTIGYQVKYATCTLLGNALTWWNSHVKIVGHDAAYGMPWKTLMKMMTNKYCPREKYVGGLPDMIQGSLMDFKPKTMQEEIEIANALMDQKNVARAYTVGPKDKKEYGGSIPRCTKCNYHHNGQCAPKCNNFKKVGHSARDCRSLATNVNNQRDPGEIQKVITCFECGVQGHCKKDCPKLRNNNRRNQAGNGGAQARAYAAGSAGKNPDANVVTGCPIFLAHITVKKTEDKSEEKRLEDVPIVQDFPEVFPKDLSGVECLLEDRPEIELSSTESSGRRHPEDRVQNSLRPL